jgi:membrane protein YqaA with SNARE-associated domain
MNQKIKISVTLVIIGIVATVFGWMGLVLYESNSLLDLVSLASAIMLYLGPPTVIAGMILAVTSTNSFKTRLLTAIVSVLVLLGAGVAYGVSMYNEDENIKDRSEAFEKCEKITDKKSALYSGCRQAAERLP